MKSQARTREQRGGWGTTARSPRRCWALRPGIHFKTSLGSYFVNVVEADLAAGAMTVQVGCEAEGNTP